MRSMQLSVTFNLEAADRSVGIMTEGFSAWESDGPDDGPFVTLAYLGRDLQSSRFEWEGTPPPDMKRCQLEALLFMFASQHYDGFVKEHEENADQARAKETALPQQNAKVYRVPARRS